MHTQKKWTDIEALAKVLVDSCFTVHSTLGPGLLESVYERCLAHELEFRGIPFQRQIPLPISYREIEIPDAFRIDLLVDGQIILELKAVENLDRIHTAQLLTYMKLSKISLGFLVTFNVPLIKDGIKI